MTDEYGQLCLHNTNTQLITLSPQNLLPKLWGWTNNKWTPDDPGNTIPLSTSYQRLVDDTTGQWVDVSLIISDNDPKPDAPLLAISQGVIMKRDLSVGGFVASNQGLIALGSGMNNSFDPPGIWLTHSEKSPLDTIETRSTPPTTDLEVGQCYIDSDNSHLYQYSGSGWIDKGDTSLYITTTLIHSTYDDLPTTSICHFLPQVFQLLILNWEIWPAMISMRADIFT